MNRRMAVEDLRPGTDTDRSSVALERTRPVRSLTVDRLDSRDDSRPSHSDDAEDRTTEDRTTEDRTPIVGDDAGESKHVDRRRQIGVVSALGANDEGEAPGFEAEEADDVGEWLPELVIDEPDGSEGSESPGAPDLAARAPDIDQPADVASALDRHADPELTALERPCRCRHADGTMPDREQLG